MTPYEKHRERIRKCAHMNFMELPTGVVVCTGCSANRLEITFAARGHDASIADTMRCVVEEVQRAEEKFPAFNSAHEGWAVLREEVDEMWDAIKANDVAHARLEAVQVAAMAVRFLRDVRAKGGADE